MVWPAVLPLWCRRCCPNLSDQCGALVDERAGAGLAQVRVGGVAVLGGIPVPVPPGPQEHGQPCLIYVRERRGTDRLIATSVDDNSWQQAAALKRETGQIMAIAVAVSRGCPDTCLCSRPC